MYFSTTVSLACFCQKFGERCIFFGVRLYTCPLSNVEISPISGWTMCWCCDCQCFWTYGGYSAMNGGGRLCSGDRNLPLTLMFWVDKWIGHTRPQGWTNCVLLVHDRSRVPDVPPLRLIRKNMGKTRRIYEPPACPFRALVTVGLRKRIWWNDLIPSEACYTSVENRHTSNTHSTRQIWKHVSFREMQRATTASCFQIGFQEQMYILDLPSSQ